MHCLKCGRNIEPPQVFCSNCTKIMNDQPVPRETPAVILPRPKTEPMRPRALKIEEKLTMAKRKNKHLRRICVAMAVLILILAVWLVLERHPDVRTVGRNYTTTILPVSGD